ncbi:Ig-like domain-containing protein, partial [Rubripirellula amarantea]|nr:Ig-like domain-containing protein [Rubripirellula amarantea]
TTVGGIETLIVQWDNRPRYSNTGSATFQVQVFASGPVLARYAYEDVDFGNPIYDFGASATIGYQFSQQHVSQYSNNTAILANGDVIDITAPTSTSDIDEYTVDLTGKVNEPIDLVVSGLHGLDMSTATLELLNTDGTTVLATGVTGATNFDVGILGYTVPADGIYTVRVTSGSLGQYSLAVTDSLVFETEPNGSGNTLRDLTAVGSGLGYLDVGSSEDRFAYTAGPLKVLEITTSTPFDNASTIPANSLNPNLTLYNSVGSSVASDADSGDDSKNAKLIYATNDAETFDVAVGQQSGMGEYVVNVVSYGITITETSGTTEVDESGTTDTFDVVLDTAPTSDVVINVTSGDIDEFVVDLPTLTFTTANWNIAQTITVTGVDDFASDGDQTIDVTLSVDDGLSDDSYDPLPDHTVSVTVQDSDVVETDVSLSSGILTITDINGGVSHDDLTISYAPGFYTISDSSLGLTTSIAGATGMGTSTLTIPDTGVIGITLDTLDGNDSITISGVQAGLGDLTVLGSAGNDAVELNSDITFATNANLNVDLANGSGAADVDQITIGVNANVSLVGSGAANLQASRSIELKSGSSVTTVNGNLTVSANQQATPTAGSFLGVDVNNAVIEATGTGVVTVAGRGGNSGNGQHGVRVVNGGDIIGGTSGVVSVTGVGGFTLGSASYGVRLTGNSSTTITSHGAAVSVAGTGGGTLNSVNHGVGIFSGATIYATGAAPVAVHGTSRSFNVSGGLNAGVVVGNAGSRIGSVDGALTVVGVGTGAVGQGIRVQAGGDISASGAGTVTLDGTGSATATGTENHGVWIGTSGGTVSSGTGALEVSATAGTGSVALKFDTGSPSLATVEAPITVMADSIEIDSNATITAGNARSVSLVPETNGTMIDLGGADVLGTTLGLSNVELNRITAGSLYVGDADTGDVTFTSPISVTSVEGLSVESGGIIGETNNGVADFTGTYLELDGIISPGASPGLLDVTGDFIVDGGSTYVVELGGLLPGTTSANHDQINATGFALLDGTLDVQLTNGFTPTVGDSFVIMTASGGILTSFVTVQLPAADWGTEWNVIYDTNEIRVELVDQETVDAIDDAAATVDGTSVNTSVTSNDLPSGQTQVISTNDGGNGTTTIELDGSITYTPNSGFTGTDTFEYTIALNDVELINSAVSGGDRFGNSVAVSGDFAVVGSFLDDPSGLTSAGSAFVYQRTGETSWTQVAQLTGDGSPHGNAGQFGYSVAIDGDTVAVSAQKDRENGFQAGAVYIFDRNEGGPDNWGRVTKLTGSDTIKRDLFGRSLALSGDTVVVGASVADPLGLSSGAAYVFERDLGGVNNWGEAKKLIASNGAAEDRFGQSVSIDGDLIAVGAFRHDGVANDTGAVYVFGRDTGGAGNWGEDKAIEAGDAVLADQFGFSVSIDGGIVAVGARQDDEGGLNQRGSVYLFGQDEGGIGNWGQVTKLLASDAVAGDRLGWSVDLSGDHLVAGAVGSDIGGVASGNAYLFENIAGTWTQTRSLNNDEVSAADEYGIAVAVDANVAVVGSWLDNRPSNNSGGAYVFDLRTDTATVTVDVSSPPSEVPSVVSSNLAGGESDDLVMSVLSDAQASPVATNQPLSHQTTKALEAEQVDFLFTSDANDTRDENVVLLSDVELGLDLFS